MPFARASELDRLLACYGSAVLPRDNTKSRGAREAAQWGTWAHQWKETGAQPKEPEAPKAIVNLFAKKLSVAPPDRDKLWPAPGEHEVALAFNVLTGESKRCVVPPLAEADYKDKWKAAFDSEWVTGTADFAMQLIKHPWIDDLKTGRLAHVKNYEAQQSFYCLAYGALTGGPRDSRSSITHWPKYPVDSGVVRTGTLFTADYLKLFWEKLIRLREDIVSKEGELFLGVQCTFCPSRAACPKLAETETNLNESKVNE